MERYITQYQFSDYDAQLICSDKDEVHYFEELIKYTQHYKAVANWIIGPLKYYCNEKNISIIDFPLSHVLIAELINLTETNQINFNNASGKILQHLITNPNQTALQAATALNLVQENNEDHLSQWVQEVLIAMPDKVKEYKSGKKGVIGLFAGEVKKRSKGKADMLLVTQLLNDRLN